MKRKLIILALLVALFATLAVSVNAATVVDSSDGWTLYSDGVLIISGNLHDYYPWVPPWRENGNENLICEVIIKDGVTIIPTWAFAGCGNLTKVTIPNSILEVGDGAFKSCYNLEYSGYYDDAMYLGNSDNPYLVLVEAGSFSITSRKIHEDTKVIGPGAFENCRNLASVDIPDSVTSIGEDAFCNCSSLTSVTIPDSVIRISYDAFKECNSLTSVNITDIAKWCRISFGNYYGNPLYLAESFCYKRR